MSAIKIYNMRTALFMTGYVAIMVAAILGAFDNIEAPGSYVFALAVAAPVVGQIWATLSYIQDSDEYVRMLTAKRFIVASGLMMVAFTVWGFMESFANAPHIEGWAVYPVFWGFYGLITPMVRHSN